MLDIGGKVGVGEGLGEAVGDVGVLGAELPALQRDVLRRVRAANTQHSLALATV